MRADLLHLKLYHASRLTDFSKIKQPLEFLGGVAASGAETLDAARSRGDAKDSDLSYSSPTPDQLRAAALPSPLALVAQIHDLLLPQAITEVGAKPVRDYLRGLMRDKGPFASYASFKLSDIDRVILAGYRADAQKAWREKKWKAARAGFSLIIKEYEGTREASEAAVELKKVVVAQYRDQAALAFAAKNFESAKGIYRRIIAEYSDTDDAIWAEAELKKIVPVAVAYYKVEGDKKYQPDDEPGIPQIKAREFYEKMYKEDPDGVQADYALLQWSRALGTESRPKEAIALLTTFLEKFPESRLRAEGMFLIGFMNASMRVQKFDQAISWMQRVAKEYPNSEEAPEALWHMAFYYWWWDDRYIEGIAPLEQLQKNHPKSPRWKHTAKWIEYFKKHSKGK